MSKNLHDLSSFTPEQLDSYIDLGYELERGGSTANIRYFFDECLKEGVPFEAAADVLRGANPMFAEGFLADNAA